MTDITSADRELLAAAWSELNPRLPICADSLDWDDAEHGRWLDAALQAIAKQRAISEAWAKQDGERAMQFDRMREDLEAVTKERDKLALDLQLRRPTDADVAQTHAARKEYRAKLKELYGNADGLPMEIARLRGLLRRAGEALKPFSTFGANNVDAEGWDIEGGSCHKDRIVDWFGPSDFRAAASLHSDILAELEGK